MSTEKLRITLLADEWNSSKGGLSTINRELAIQLAKHPNVAVTFFVLKCTEEVKKAASTHNISVVEAKALPGFSEAEWLCFPPKDLYIDIIIGHGAKLGKQAQVIRESHHCTWMQFVHTAPEELAMFKAYSGAISKGDEKQWVEVKLCTIADLVVAVGPKLYDIYSRYLSRSGKKVINLTPGIFTELSDLKQSTQGSKKFWVLVFGRGESEDFELKGFDIAAKAVAELNDKSYHLIFVGAPSGNGEQVVEKLLEQGLSRNQLTVKGYLENRDDLATLLSTANLVLIPSRTEGFGLTALEALSAGLPFLVSQNSGFGEALQEVPFDSSWIIDSEDPEEWAKAIKGVREKGRETALKECQELRTRYAEKYSWEKQCNDLVEMMRTLVGSTSFLFNNFKMKCLIGEGVSVDILRDDLTCVNVIEQKLSTVVREDSDDAFYIVDLADVLLKHKKWVSLLPRVEPFYAMKCNNDPVILKMLTGLGIGFDCASKTEMKTMLGMGVSPSKIVYANPCKQASHIRFSATHGISLMTFDNEMELHKIKELYPTARLLLRIRTDDSKSLCQLGIKYGAPLKQCRHLLKVAHDLKLNVIGVSFHVGSGCYDASAFGTAVLAARSVFDLGAQIGYNFTLLDIGGGFPGAPDAAITFEEVCAILNPLLEEHFPVSSGVRIIAEPGRYYSASAFTLVVNVVARRTVKGSQFKQDDKSAEAAGYKDSDKLGFMYYINDGVYGSFNCLVFDHATVNPEVFGTDEKAEKFPSSIWGPTCDSLDCITKNVLLPKVDVGEWLYFRNLGAYTCSAASTFDGFNKPPKCYTIAHSCSSMLKKVLEKIGLDVHLPCHVSMDQKTSFITGPEFMEILASAK